MWQSPFGIHAFLYVYGAKRNGELDSANQLSSHVLNAPTAANISGREPSFEPSIGIV